MTKDEHQLGSCLQSAIALPWVLCHGKNSSPVNSQAAAVHTYPGLPPVAELIPEAKDPGRSTDMSSDQQEDSSN